VGETALITGASSGLGRACAQILAADGWDLVLLARRAAALQSLAAELTPGVRVETVPLDLTDEDAQVRLEGLFAERQVDLLVHAAGTGDFGPFVDLPPERIDAALALNVRACTRVVHAAAAAMVARGAGRILAVASVAAFEPGPLMSVYYASKAFELALCEAVAAEVAGSGVTVTALCPGPFRSGFHEAAGMRIPPGDRRRMPTARRVAAFGLRAALRGRAVAVYGAGFRLMVVAIRFLPRRVVVRLVHRLQRRRAGGPMTAR
jgi:hypothetical protein